MLYPSPHLQPLSVFVKDPRPPVQRALLPECSLDGGAVVGESQPSHRTRRRHPRRRRKLAAERRDAGREGRALGEVVRRTAEM